MKRLNTRIIINALVDVSDEGELSTPCTTRQAENLPKVLLKIARHLKNGQYAAIISLIESLKMMDGAE